MKYFVTAFLFTTLIIAGTFPLRAQESFGEILGAKKAVENQGLQKKAIFGSVNEITTKKIKVQDLTSNIATEAVLDSKTKLIGRDKKILRLNDIKLQDKVAIVSSDSAMASDGAMIKKAVKIYLKSAAASGVLKRQAIQGVITDIAGNTLTLTHQIQRDRVYQVSFTAATLVKMKDNPAASIADLAVAQRIVVVGSSDASGAFTATRIHIIPGKATGIFEKLPVTPKPTVDLTLTPAVTAIPTGSLSGTPTPDLTVTPDLTATPTVDLEPTSTPGIAVPTSTPTPTT